MQSGFALLSGVRAVYSSASPPWILAADNFAVNGSHSLKFNQNGRLHARRGMRRVENKNFKYTAVQAVRKHEKVGENSLTEDKVTARYDEGQDRLKSEPLLQERVSNDRVRRYWLDELSGLLAYEEVNVSTSKDREENNRPGKDSQKTMSLLPRIPLPKVVADFILPAGFPDSVSSDYLQYMLWQFPTNVTGWICSTLVTSSLFKAVGVGIGGGYAAAATATIKWVSKDGLGALGLLLIGGRFGTIFDEDPKQWRMYADLIGSAGSIFELYTPVAPDQFLLLGSFGYLFKAVAKGLKDPSFRVIQNHFATTENVGDVSAKEEVWEVSAKLLGLSIAVLLLGMPGLSDSYWKLVAIWISLRSIHLWLRYQSLKVVQFSNINFRRATVLVRAHLEGHSIPGCEECNKSEKFLVWWQLMSPRVKIGCSLKDVLESYPPPLEVEELLKLYATEFYVLVLHTNSVGALEARILAKEGATSVDVLQSLWQAYWLLLPSTSKGQSLRADVSTSSDMEETSTVNGGSLREHVTKLSRSMEAVHLHFDSFLSELEASGWDLDKVVLKVPRGAPVLM